MSAYRCAWPGCPRAASVAGTPCMRHRLQHIRHGAHSRLLPVLCALWAREQRRIRLVEAETPTQLSIWGEAA